MWTWYLLSQHPIVEAKLFDEVDTVLGSVPVSFTNVQHLPYTEKVLTEALRLFPPGWALARFAIKDYRVGTYMIPAGSVVIISQYVS